VVPAGARPRTPRYRWLGGPLSRAQWIASLATLAVAIGLGALYLGYLYGGDVAPDSPFGYGCALVGTLLLLGAGLGYLARKRWGRQRAGRLHVLLAWHIAASVVGLLLILMHATGNFNARSGTYALYGLVALVVSGVIGRALDRLGPWLAARAALATLTVGGEDQLDELERQPLPHPPRSAPTGAATRRHAAGAPWDVAYFDLDPEVESIPSLIGARPAVPEPRPRVWGAPPVELRRQAAVLRSALWREAFSIQLVRVWRRLHLLISVVFLGLLIWHIIFAVTLLLHAR
jgi:hypothetical protein